MVNLDILKGKDFTGSRKIKVEVRAYNNILGAKDHLNNQIASARYLLIDTLLTYNTAATVSDNVSSINLVIANENAKYSRTNKYASDNYYEIHNPNTGTVEKIWSKVGDNPTILEPYLQLNKRIEVWVTIGENDAYQRFTGLIIDLAITAVNGVSELSLTCLDMAGVHRKSFAVYLQGLETDYKFNVTRPVELTSERVEFLIELADPIVPYTIIPSAYGLDPQLASINYTDIVKIEDIITDTKGVTLSDFYATNDGKVVWEPIDFGNPNQTYTTNTPGLSGSTIDLLSIKAGAYPISGLVRIYANPTGPIGPRIYVEDTDFTVNYNTGVITILTAYDTLSLRWVYSKFTFKEGETIFETRLTESDKGLASVYQLADSKLPLVPALVGDSRALSKELYIDVVDAQTTEGLSRIAQAIKRFREVELGQVELAVVGNPYLQLNDTITVIEKSILGLEGAYKIVGYQEQFADGLLVSNYSINYVGTVKLD